MFTSQTLNVRAQFIAALTSNQDAFRLELDDPAVGRLADYYELVLQSNPLLHLVGPCSPQEFATRHVLESLTLLEYLPERCRFADIGPGAGLPSIPCVLVRKDLSAVLIESKEKKSAFLAEAASNLFLTERVKVIAKQFEEVRDLDFEFVTCRALDRFVDKLPRLIKWAKRRKLLLFGGNALAEALDRARIAYDSRKMPLSEQRYLFVSS